MAMWNKLINATKWLWSDPPPPPVFPPETALLSMPGLKPDGFVHGIELLNDDKPGYRTHRAEEKFHGAKPRVHADARFCKRCGSSLETTE